MNAPENGAQAVCRTCREPIVWWAEPIPCRPDLSGAWWDAEDRRGVRGRAGHEHRP